MTCETRDLRPFTDPDAEVYRLDLASSGDAGRLAIIQEKFRREEIAGSCRIFVMTDDIAVVRWKDEFVLTITDPRTRAAMGWPPLSSPEAE